MPVEVREMELEIAAEARALADDITEALLRERVRDVALQAEATTAAFADREFRHGGTRPAAVTPRTRTRVASLGGRGERKWAGGRGEREKAV
jgi:hypothetical protein